MRQLHSLEEDPLLSASDGSCPTISQCSSDYDTIAWYSLNKQWDETVKRAASAQETKSAQSSQFPGSLSHHKLSIALLQWVCTSGARHTLPCPHIGGRFLCTPPAERTDSTSIHVWSAEGPYRCRRPASQTLSQYSQAWEAWRCWATAWTAPREAAADWLSLYPISCKMSQVTCKLW